MFQYITGNAATIAAFFAVFEAYAIQIGWTVAAGAGTTTLVLSSPGENDQIPPKTKLFIRVRQNGNNIEGRVQDDLAGTHVTTTGAFIDGAAGAFTYHISGDKDAIAFHTLNIAAHREMYLGLGIPIAVNTADETYFMLDSNNITTKVLRLYTGVWDQSIASYRGSVEDTTIRDRFDLSVVLSCKIAGNVDLRCAQFKHISYPITPNPPAVDDTITTGPPHTVLFQTTWIVVSTNAGARFAMRTGGAAPYGDALHEDKGNWQIDRCFYIWDNRELIDRIVLFLQGIGWIANDHSPISGLDRDYIMHSHGESGIEDINIRFYWARAWNSNMYISMCDDLVPTHERVIGTPLPATQVGCQSRHMIQADRDCFIILSEQNTQATAIGECFADPNIIWVGRGVSFAPGLYTANSVYSLGATNRPTNVRFSWRMRDHDGTWTPAADININWGDDSVDGYADNNPNLYDGLTYFLFPIKLRSAAGEHYIQLKYMWNVSTYGGGSPGDYVTIENKTYKIFCVHDLNRAWYAVRWN